VSGSTIPAALAALVAAFTNAAPAGCDVVYGFPYDVDTFWMAVGWDRTDQPAVVATVTDLTAGGRRGLEQFDVSCLLSLAHGDQDPATVVGEVFAAYEVFAAAVVTNPTLSGAVMRAWPADYDLTPNATETGDSAELRFTVHCEAIK
jgi:hypothetical protein